MKALDYKGYKSTRMQTAIAVFFLGTYFFVSEMLTADQWIDLTVWLFGIYAGSEGVAKGASAWSMRGTQKGGNDGQDI